MCIHASGAGGGWDLKFGIVGVGASARLLEIRVGSRDGAVAVGEPGGGRRRGADALPLADVFAARRGILCGGGPELPILGPAPATAVVPVALRALVADRVARAVRSEAGARPVTLGLFRTGIF